MTNVQLCKTVCQFPPICTVRCHFALLPPILRDHSLHWKQDWPAVSKLLPVIEKELAPFHARPHWGKLFTTSPAALKDIYTEMPDFIELAKKYDPQAKFRNDFLNKNIFLT